MEVHRHPEPHHKKKSLKEYFFDFLMIFLAVTLSFIAENIREHLNNKTKERGNIANMLEDLRSDTSILHSRILMWENFQKGIDTSEKIIQMPHPENELNMLYRNAIWIGVFLRSGYTNRTFEEMKNSGSFRLLENKNVTDSLIAYDNFVKNFIASDEEPHYDYFMNHVMPSFEQVIDLTLFRARWTELANSNGFESGMENSDAKVANNLRLITTDKVVLEKFAGQLTYYYADGVALIQIMRERLLMATHLIQQIRKEYY